MSTKKKAAPQQSAYDFIRRPAGNLSVVMSPEQTKEAEEDNKRLLRLRPWKALDDLRKYEGDDYGWYQIQLRLYVGQEFVAVVNHLYDGIPEDILKEMYGNMDDAILALNAAAIRVNNGDTKKRYLSPVEAMMVEVALRQTDELETGEVDGISISPLIVFKVYRHIQEFLSKDRPKKRK